jgi:hypothetical protein
MRSNKACPAPDCVAANPSQKDASADLASHGVTAEWVRSAMVCSYCCYSAWGLALDRRPSRTPVHA